MDLRSHIVDRRATDFIGHLLWATSKCFAHATVSFHRHGDHLMEEPRLGQTATQGSQMPSVLGALLA